MQLLINHLHPFRGPTGERITALFVQFHYSLIIALQSPL